MDAKMDDTKVKEYRRAARRQMNSISVDNVALDSQGYIEFCNGQDTNLSNLIHSLDLEDTDGDVHKVGTSIFYLLVSTEGLSFRHLSASSYCKHIS